MSQKAKSPATTPGSSENVQEQNGDDYTISPPSKIETVISAFIEFGDLNTFQANKIYGDTCLHTSVNDIRRKTGIILNRKSERVINRIGKRVSVKRYWLPDIEKARLVVRQLKHERGVEEVSE